MEHANIKELNVLHTSSHANKQHHHPITKKLDVTNIHVIYDIHELHDVIFDSDGCTIQSTASSIPIAYAHAEDSLYILNTASPAHYLRIHANHSCLNKPDKKCHQLNPQTIKCGFFGSASS
jgi:hypothetical protein